MSSETSVDDEAPRGRRAAHWTIGALLALITVAAVVYGRAVKYGYLPWDDFELIVQNPHLQSNRMAGLRGIWTSAYDGFYMPVTYTSWWLEKLLRLDARASHAGNLFIHALTSWGVFLVGVQLLRRKWANSGCFNLAALIGAIIFCVHPLQAEPVAWATGRKEMLAGVFSVFAALAYVKGVELRKWYFVSLLLFALAALSKPAVVTLPAVLLLLDWAVLKSGWRPAMIRSLPLFVIGAISAWIVFVVQRSAAAVGPISDVAVSFSRRPLIAGDALAFYAQKLSMPISLSPVYDKFVSNAKAVVAIVALCVAAGIFVAAIARRCSTLSLAAGAVLLLVPVSGLVPFHYQSISTVADRYMYLALIPVALLVAFAMGMAINRGGAIRAVVCAVAAMVIVGLAVISFRQTGYWSDSLTLWSRAVKVAPGNAIARSNLAMSLAEAGRADDALAQLEEAVRLKPDFALAQNNLGTAYEQRGLRDQALVHYESAVRANPKLGPAQASLAAIYFQQQRPDEAAKAARAALELMPDHFTSLAVLASVLGSRGEVQDALKLLREAAARNLNDSQIQQLLAQAEAIARQQ